MARLNNNFYIPKPQESHIIQAMWEVNYHTQFLTENIVPKGVVEIIFNFTNQPIWAQTGHAYSQLPKVFINGFNTAPISIALPKQQMFFGIQLQPLAVAKLFGESAGEFANRNVDLALIDPTIETVWHQLAEQVDFARRVSVFTSWALKRNIECEPRERFINSFLQAAAQHRISVPALANAVCYSQRQLTRKIIEATGMNSEELLMYKKYQHAIQLMHQTPLTLTEIAHQSHFSDQSHFIKSFRAFTHMTPGAYRKNKSFLTGHLYNNVR